MIVRRATAESPANIAFIKYWGQRDSTLVLPSNDSFSMNLSHCTTQVAIELLPDPGQASLQITAPASDETMALVSRKADPGELASVQKYILFLTEHFRLPHQLGWSIASHSTFPIKAGIASSAAFYSALAKGFCEAIHQNPSERELSILARRSGSGSATRSIPDGYVWWHSADRSDESYAESIAPPEFWNLTDMVLLLSSAPKETGSARGHLTASSSPYFSTRLSELPERALQVKNAFFKRDWEVFGTLIEQEALLFHAICMTQNPSLLYWSAATIDAIHAVHRIRKSGLLCFFTIDAGANIHLIAQGDDTDKVKAALVSQGIHCPVIINGPCSGAHLVSSALNTHQ